jgi:hypothetical protein
MDDLLADCQTRGFSLRDLSSLSVDIMLNTKRRPCIYWQIPSYIKVVSDGQFSTFRLIVGGVGSNGLDEVECGREWVACCFLDLILDRVIQLTRKALRRIR